MFKYLLSKRETIFYENADEGIRCEILNKFKVKLTWYTSVPSNENAI
jgi:hypothetical protein